jgi:thiamine-phosphate pyrophosphorylase
VESAKFANGCGKLPLSLECGVKLATALDTRLESLLDLLMKPLSECRLYAFVDTAYLKGRVPEQVASQLCDGGADLIQLRAKNSSPEEIAQLARSILPVTNAAGVGLVINDYPSIARDLGADFAHLGQEDFFDAGYQHVSELQVPNSALRFGLSTHGPEQARRAVNAGAHYLAVGPVYATGTKPGAKPVTLDYVRWAAANLTVPWFAIGGINLENLEEVLAAGAQRVCVVSAILNSENISSTCRAFKRRLEVK